MAAYYPELVALYRHLGIPFAPASFSFSFGRAPESKVRVHGTEPDFLYSGLTNKGRKFIRRGSFASPFFVLTTVWSYLVILFMAYYHTAMGHTQNMEHKIYKRTFGEWCDSIWIHRSFVGELLIPLFCSIMTANVDAVRSMPAAEVLDYVARTFLYDHYTVQGGVSQVVDGLSFYLSPSQKRVGVTITDVFPQHVNDKRQFGLRFTTADGEQMEATFDHIVFASQATQTARMLEMYYHHLSRSSGNFLSSPHSQRCRQQLESLRRMRYEKSTVVCHTDTTILPPKQEHWRDLNLVSPLHPHSPDASFTMATHIIWRTSDEVVMQTTNPLPYLFPLEHTWISKSTFERFVLTLQGRDARQSFFLTRGAKHGRPTSVLGPLQGPPEAPVHVHSQREACAPFRSEGGFWFCGSWSYGVPLLEGAFLVVH